MVGQNYLEVKKFFISVILFLISIKVSFAENFNFKKIVDLNDPWSSTFINNNELLITEKSGKIKLVNFNSKKVLEIKHNLNYLEHGQGGLLDILFKDDYVYISYTENRGDGKTSTSIAKGEFNKNNLMYSSLPLITHAKNLFPICRSLTGAGICKTLEYFETYHKEYSRLKFNSGVKVFDWEIPKEWNIIDAYIENINTGVKYAEFQKSNLHVVGYSLPVDIVLELEDLKKKIFTEEKQPSKPIEAYLQA